MGLRLSRHLNTKELEELQKKTNYTQDELRAMWKENHFKKHKMNKNQLLQMLRKHFVSSSSKEADEALVERVFELFDLDKNGSICFEEFACGMSLLCKGSHEEKLEFIFNVFDIDGNGVISRDEFTKIVSIVYDSPLAQKILALDVDKTKQTVSEFVENFFKKADYDRNGTISLDEYITVAMKEIIESGNTSDDEEESKHSSPLRKPTSYDSPIWGSGSGRINYMTLRETNPDALKIFVIGPPLSEKREVAKRIAEKFSLTHISTAHLLHSEANQTSRLGIRLKYYFNRNLLVPDDLVSQVVEKRLDSADCANFGWVLDGYPRTKEQILFMNQSGSLPDKIILIKMSDDTVLQRAESIAYNSMSSMSSMSSASGSDDSKGSYKSDTLRELSSSDNKPNKDKVKEALTLFNENTHAIRHLYENIIKEVDGNRDVTSIFAECEDFLTKMQSSRRASFSSASDVDTYHTLQFTR